MLFCAERERNVCRIAWHNEKDCHLDWRGSLASSSFLWLLPRSFINLIATLSDVDVCTYLTQRTTLAERGTRSAPTREQDTNAIVEHKFGYDQPGGLVTRPVTAIRWLSIVTAGGEVVDGRPSTWLVVENEISIVRIVLTAAAVARRRLLFHLSIG